MTKKILFKLALSLAAVVALVGLVMGIMRDESGQTRIEESGQDYGGEVPRRRDKFGFMGARRVLE